MKVAGCSCGEAAAAGVRVMSVKRQRHQNSPDHCSFNSVGKNAAFQPGIVL